MSSNNSDNQGPKLYTTKPKKSQLKQQQSHKSAKDFSTPAMSTPPTSGIPPPPKESFARRYKYVWPALLTINLAIGGYLFLRTNNKDKGKEEDEAAAAVPSTPTASTSAPVSETPLTAARCEPVIVREPIPEDKQKELFKWILEEKRKIKPKDPEEKKQIDEEKAILKQFIQAKSIPSL